MSLISKLRVSGCKAFEPAIPTSTNLCLSTADLQINLKLLWPKSLPDLLAILQSKTIKNRDQYEFYDFSVVTMTIANVKYSKPSG